jgi:Glycosyl Hydrolase Family 88.
MLLVGITGAGATNAAPEDISASISLKVPGNDAKQYPLALQKMQDGMYSCRASEKLPLDIIRQVVDKDGKQRITVTLKALENVYFNYGEQIKTGYKHSDCQFYMPGFWYRRNLRSPKEAPSFHTSDSWLVREDRLSTPLTAAFNLASGTSMSVIRIDKFDKEALTTHKEGEVILSGETSIGYTGFCNVDGMTVLAYGFPYKEAPKTYIRKLTLAPAVEAFQLLRKGDSISVTWEVSERNAADFSECVQHTWEYCYDTNRPKPVDTPYTVDRMKEVMSNFFVESYVSNTPTHYYSGVELETATCANTDVAEVGFVGRTLLNAFNALEYGKQQNRQDLVDNANHIFDTYLQNGFSPAGFFNEVVHYNRGFKETRHSIRRQSEGVYAILNYLNYEKQQKRKHPEWEKRIKGMLDSFLKLQNEDGSFPRKFKDDFSVVDASGGSTPSATLPLVMASKYFKDKRYLASAKRTVDYLEKELISKADYFSSTLDANCEDKEASLYAATAAYYLALVTKGEERAHYAGLAKKAAYFALSWYYTWDVPFAEGQMLGDIGLKTRGWGNVSVENNHIDVFIFEFADVLHWLSKEYNEPRFSDFAEVISTSMRQLLPYEGHMCGIAKVGYYPEVVQHTNWDYGRNGKGYYNNIFAPGWTVASLWELFTPGRAEQFLLKK